MKKKMFILICICMHVKINAQYSLNSASYSQDFNTMIKSNGSSSTLPNGDLSGMNVALNGWYFSETGTGANNTITANNGATNTGDTYSYGVNNNSDRTLGALRSATVASTFGFYFINNTGSTITFISITYTGKTWRVGAANRSDRLDFQYSSNASSLTTGSWTDFDPLDYQNTPATTASTGLTQTASISATLTGLNIINGSSFFIRWADLNIGGSNDGMGIDDITIYASSGTPSSQTDYFRSSGSGFWGSPSSWESSSSSVGPWHPASLEPTGSASGVTITNTITIDKAVSAKLLTIASGGTLTYSANGGWALTIADDGNAATVDFMVAPGAQFLLYGRQPVFSGNATGEVYGTVKAMDNTNGESDDFARNTSVLFKTGSVFMWHCVTPFETTSATYFAAPGYQNEKPVFRVDTVPTVGAASARDTLKVGANSTTTFNGKFEVYNYLKNNSPTATIVKFQQPGSKVFRDGMGGNGKIIHDSVTCGTFQITGSDAVIDGSVKLDVWDNLNIGTDFEIPASATLTISGSAVVNIGPQGSSTITDMLINGTIKNNSSVAFGIIYCRINLYGSFDPLATGSFKAGYGSGSQTKLFVKGTGSPGTFTLSALGPILDTLSIDRTGGNLLLGSDMQARCIILKKGLIITGYHLLTWLNSDNDPGSTLSAPNIPWSLNSSSYSDSYIATCDANGNPLPPVYASTGNYGLCIENVGLKPISHTNAETYFPIGANLNTANRAMLYNTGTLDKFTICVGIGDIGNTPAPVVERIWYITEGIAGGSKVQMKLFFTKRDPALYPSSQNDEVETGFDYTDMHLVQETFANKFVNNSIGSDVLFDLSGPTPPGVFNYGTELYGQYTFTSNSSGITGFTRFSIVNQQSYILPLQIVDFAIATRNQTVQARFTSLSENGTILYELQRSTDAVNYLTVSAVAPKNTGNKSIYEILDQQPLNTACYYRIKAVGKDGRITYSIVLVNRQNTSVATITAYPNPVTNKNFILQIANLPAGTYNLSVYSFKGALVYTNSLQHNGGNTNKQLTLPTNMAKGNYELKITGNNCQKALQLNVQ